MGWIHECSRRRLHPRLITTPESGKGTRAGPRVPGSSWRPGRQNRGGPVDDVWRLSNGLPLQNAALRDPLGRARGLQWPAGGVLAFGDAVPLQGSPRGQPRPHGRRGPGPPLAHGQRHPSRQNDSHPPARDAAGTPPTRPEGHRGCLLESSLTGAYAKSKRSSSMTFTQAATKSRTNFSLASSWA